MLYSIFIVLFMIARFSQRRRGFIERRRFSTLGLWRKEGKMSALGRRGSKAHYYIRNRLLKWKTGAQPLAQGIHREFFSPCFDDGRSGTSRRRNCTDTASVGRDSRDRDWFRSTSISKRAGGGVHGGGSRRRWTEHAYGANEHENRNYEAETQPLKASLDLALGRSDAGATVS